MSLIRIWNSFHYILSTDVTKRSKRSMSNCINFLKFCDVHGDLTCVCKQSLARTGQDALRALALSTDKLINFDKRTQTFRYSLTWSDCMSKNRDFIISQKSHTLVYSTRFVLYTVCSRTDQIHGRHAKDMCLQTRGYPCKFRVPTPFQTCSKLTYFESWPFIFIM